MGQARINEPGNHILVNGVCYAYVIDHDNGNDTFNGWYWRRGLLGALDKTIADGVAFDTITDYIAEGTNNTLHSNAACCT